MEENKSGQTSRPGKRIIVDRKMSVDQQKIDEIQAENQRLKKEVGQRRKVAKITVGAGLLLLAIPMVVGIVVGVKTGAAWAGWLTFVFLMVIFSGGIFPF